MRSPRTIKTAAALGAVVVVALPALSFAGPAGAAEVTAPVGALCQPAPVVRTQQVDIPMTVTAPDVAEAGDEIVVSVSTALPPVVVNSFVITLANSVYQMPDQVTLNSVSFTGGDSGSLNPGGTWGNTVTINPTAEEIVDAIEWFYGAPASENPYFDEPVQAAVGDGWEPNANTALLELFPDPPNAPADDPAGFNGKPQTPTVNFHVTVNADVTDTWIEWLPMVDSYSVTNTPFGQTRTHCPVNDPNQVITATAIGSPITTTTIPDTTTTTTGAPTTTTGAPTSTAAPTPAPVAKPRYTG